MKRLFKILITAALLTGIAAGLTGCGSTSAKQETPAAGGKTTKSGYTVGKSIQAIKDKGYLTIGCDSSYAPFSFIDTTSDNKSPVGIDIELGRAIAEEIGVEARFEPMLFKALLSSLSTDMIDIGIDAITPTEERKKIVDFSDMYILCEDKMIVKKENLGNLATLESFYGKPVAANTGSIQEKFANDFIKNAQIFSSPNLPTSILELQAGHVAGIVVEKSVGQQYIAAYPNLAFSDAVLTGSYAKGYSVAYKKGGDDLGALINGVVAKVKADGKIEQWRDQYSETAAKMLISNKK